jgi:hypothetical protein
MKLNGFNEQVVKRAKKPKNLIIKIIAVLLLILIPVICFVLAFTFISYMIYVGFFLFLAGIYIVWYVFTSQNVEFEYSVSGGELEVAKIISLRKRKKICKIKINEIEILGKGEKTIEGMRFAKSYIAAADLDKDDDNYFAVFNSAARGRCLLIFTPNSDTLESMKPNLNRQLVVKLFYNNRNVG